MALPLSGRLWNLRLRGIVVRCEATLASGFDAHLTKPIDHAVLKELLGDLSAKR